MELLSKIQKNLNAPKNLYNKFGGYNYRSCEGILEAVKKISEDSSLIISDEIVEVGGRVYVKATATYIHKDVNISVSAFAREEENKKGMDSAQITGSTSSYARKYALNGLFLIDDTKDADTMDNNPQNTPVKESVKKAPPEVDAFEADYQKCKKYFINQEDDSLFYDIHMKNKLEKILQELLRRKRNADAEELESLINIKENKDKIPF